MSPLRFLRTAPRSALAILTLITVLAAVSGAFVVLAPEAAAQEDPAIARARERLQQAQSEANAAHDRYEKAIDERDQAQAQIAELEAAIPVLRAQEAELRTQETLLRAQLGIRAAALYKHTDPAEGLEVLAAKDRMRAGRKTKLTEAADQFDDERARQLLETADRVQKMQAELDAKRAELEDKRAELDRLVTRLDQEKAVFEQKVAAANRALEVAEEIGALRALGEPVMGPPVLSAAELVAWYRSTGSSPRLSGVTIDELAQMFIEEGLAENVRGDFAFAQAYHETGGFRTGGSENNFSGLGACDGCAGQRRFPTALDGVRAQIQHLRNYADRRSRATDLAHPPSPYWYGSDPATAARNFDSFFPKGWAPTWQLMGRGNWATDPNYASKVIGVYNRMIATKGV
ncbi:MAG TPA: glucosaminidase domain-containing protein [Acidimicrobiia bacterium]|nr:glucosaminidase domain-containing protein [Acidimicrobiia bacterium]